MLHGEKSQMLDSLKALFIVVLVAAFAGQAVAACACDVAPSASPQIALHDHGAPSTHHAKASQSEPITLDEMHHQGVDDCQGETLTVSDCLDGPSFSTAFELTQTSLPKSDLTALAAVTKQSTRPAMARAPPQYCTGQSTFLVDTSLFNQQTLLRV